MEREIWMESNLQHKGYRLLLSLAAYVSGREGRGEDLIETLFLTRDRLQHLPETMVS
jgi:hypothetical protein